MELTPGKMVANILVTGQMASSMGTELISNLVVRKEEAYGKTERESDGQMNDVSLSVLTHISLYVIFILN